MFLTPFGPRLDVEQPKHILLAHTEVRRRAVAVEDLLEQRPFRLEDLGDSRFDRARREEARDEDRGLLPQAVGAVDCLGRDRRVPPPVVEEDVVRELEIRPDAPRAIAPRDDVLLRFALDPRAIERTIAMFPSPYLDERIHRWSLAGRGGRWCWSWWFS